MSDFMNKQYEERVRIVSGFTEEAGRRYMAASEEHGEPTGSATNTTALQAWYECNKTR